MLERLGSYTIQSLLGAGGMGEVYRAHDSKLGRDVALKVLPASFAGDRDRLSRFEREAFLLASLNHPNIATIHGIEEEGGVRALVLELIDGPTLADRIRQGALPMEEALGIARQIADALQAAHDQGVIHRDLKPANVKVRPDGTVKVLDFGLAKFKPGGPGGADGPGGALLKDSPTQVVSMPGLLLGTAAYMSPEQAKGREADRRSDTWSFGCVLFEMLTGGALFIGNTSSEVIAGVLKTDPDWRRLPADTPEAVRRLLRRCLEKDDRRRLRDMADARLEIDDARSEVPAAVAAAPSRRRPERFVWGGAVAALALIAAVTGVLAVRTPPAQPEMVFDIITPPMSDPDDLQSLAISPDGRTLVFLALSEGQSHLWVRALDSVVAQPLKGTARARLPFWSPDGRSVGFFVDGLLKRLDLDGGLVRTLGTATFGFGGAWNRDGVILFAPNPASSIVRVSADGGTPANVTRLEPGQAGHGMPSFLPDGRHFLYVASGSPGARGVYVGQLDGSLSRRLIDAYSGAVYASGHILFDREGTLFAQKFDAERLELQGSPSPVLDGILGGTFLSALSAAGGNLALRVGLARADRLLVWVDRSGKEIEVLGSFGGNTTSIAPSPDGEHLAFFRTDGNSDVWQLELRRKLVSRLTTSPAEDIFPIWARDGSRILFTSNREGISLYQKRTAGNEAETLVLAGTLEETFATDTSPDGQLVLFQRRSVKTGWDVWSLPLNGTGAPTPVVQTEFDEANAKLSRDGKWLAYVANGSGQSEVYVQPFPGPGQRQQVSTGGGAKLRWSRDGQELFFLGPDAKLMAAPLRVAADGRSLNVGIPVPLFTSRAVGGGLDFLPNVEYIVSSDGQRFLMNVSRFDSSAALIRLIVNWKAGS